MSGRQTGVDVVVGQGYFGGHIGQLVKILAARPECDMEAEKSCRSCVQRDRSMAQQQLQTFDSP